MSLLPNILPPTAASDLFQSGNDGILPGKSGESDEPFDDLMRRALSAPASDKSPVDAQNWDRGKIGPDHFQLDSKNSKYGGEFQTNPANAPTTGAAGANPTTAVANINLVQEDTTTSPPNKISAPDRQFVHLMNSSLPPGSSKNPLISQSFNPNASLAAKTAGNDASVHFKETKAVEPSPDIKRDDGVASSDAAKNSTAQPEINSAAAIPPNLMAQILAPVAIAVGAGLNAKAPMGNSYNSKSSSPLPVVSGVNNSSTAAAKIPGTEASQNQPVREAGSKNQDDAQKKNPAGNGIQLPANNDAAGAMPAALTPIRGQVSPAVNGADADPKDLKTAAKPGEDSPQAGLAAIITRAATLAASAQAIGTPTAQQDELMNNGGKSAKTADLTGKFLPGSVAVIARGNDLPTRADQLTATSAINVSSNSSTQTNAATETIPTASAIENPAVEDLRSQALERMHDLVAVQAMRLSDTGTDSSLQVVIKPGAGTQLSLELRQSGSGVEAQASLQQGDFKHLSQQWPDLQQRLEQRGIRLAPLADDGSSAGNNGQTFNQKQNQSGEAAAEMAFAAPAARTFTPSALRGKASGGWETWA